MSSPERGFCVRSGTTLDLVLTVSNTGSGNNIMRGYAHNFIRFMALFTKDDGWRFFCNQNLLLGLCETL